MSKYYYKATVTVNGRPELTCEGSTAKECAENAIEVINYLPKTAHAECRIVKVEKAEDDIQEMQ